MCGLLLTSNSLLRHDYAASLISHRGLRSKTVELRLATLTHARLPIVGLSEEYDQPAKVGSTHFMFVGELLNFREDYPEHESDVQTVVETWSTSGPYGFARYDGFWSIVAYDEATGHVELLCDYLAQKPLYYRTDVLAVASEPQALAILLPTTPDEVYLSDVIKWGYCPEPSRTPYEQIRRVLPGEYLELDDLGNVLRRSIVDPIRPCPLAPSELKHEIVAAVKRRVESSDVPVACLLSGGLDSSITYTLARRYGSVQAYYASEEAAAPDILDLTKDFRSCSWSDVSVDEALKIMGEPLDLGSLLPQLSLARSVTESVCLTGDGADEFFGGYGRAIRYDSQASDVFQELVCWHLPRLDRIMMSERVEVRSPFLARRVCEAALALPWRERRGKKILRDLFRDDLPPGVADRPKEPLRTAAVEHDREAWSKMLVDKFRSTTW